MCDFENCDDNSEMRPDQLDEAYPKAQPSVVPFYRPSEPSALSFYRPPYANTVLPPVKITRGEEILRGMIVLGRVYRYLQAQPCHCDTTKNANRNARGIIRDLYSQCRADSWINQFTDDYVYNWGA
jgi:hypothetical protein